MATFLQFPYTVSSKNIASNGIQAASSRASGNAGRLISYIIFIVKDHIDGCCKLKFSLIHDCRLAVSGANKQGLHLFLLSVLMLFWFSENEH